MKVGIHAKFFMDWGGGIDFLRILLRGLKQIQKEERIELVFLVPIPTMQSQIKYSIKKVVFPIIKKNIIAPNLNITNLKQSFSNEGSFEWVYYKDTLSAFKQICIQHKFEIIIPCFQSLGPNFPIPWIGYIYDFQHKYLPDWFSKKDIQMRNKQFGTTLSEATFVIVNAKSVANDIAQFYHHTKSEIVALPFTPLFDLNVYELGDLVQKYNLTKDYFLVSNQFWKHKNHNTLFDAMALFINTNPAISLVCTGEMKDYRNPAYIDLLNIQIEKLGIKNNLIFTGYISKQEQKSLMYHAKAVIQPTLFEGGPGGGAVYEALGMGIPVVLSDIPVNREIESPLTVFFESLNAVDLCDKMKDVLNLSRMSAEELIEYRFNSEKILGSTISHAIANCKSSYVA
jgi:glycosyltransferase involved in cell wall biosynthesis